MGIALSGSVAGLFGADGAHGSRREARFPGGGGGYGPLVDDPAGLLSLPAGFAYSVIAESGVTPLESGEPDAVGSGRRGELRPPWRAGQRADRQP